MGRTNRASRKAARKSTRNAHKKERPCQCNTCKFDRNELEEGLHLIRDVMYFVTECGRHLPMADIMYQNFRKKEYFDMADGDAIVQIDNSDPYNVAINNLEIKKNLVCYADGCSNTINLKRCSGCRRVRYCSEECQLKDWQEHKTCCTSREPTVQLPPGYKFTVKSFP